MTEQLNQKISQLLDDDLSPEEALNLLITLKGRPELQLKMSRYEAMGHILKSEALIPVKTDFALQVSARIKNEPTVLMTTRKSHSGFYLMLSALAASMVIAAFIIPSVEQIKHDNVTVAKASSVLTLTQSDNIPQMQRITVPPEVVYDHAIHPDRTVSRLTEYLQAHNSSRYIDGSVNLNPYARTVSFNQE